MPGLNLAATISLDGSGFERGMARIGASAASGIKNLIAGAVGVYALEAAFRKTIDTADELVNTSKRLDISIEKLQVLRQAAKDSGTEMDSLATAMEKLGSAKAIALGEGPGGQGKAAQGMRNMFGQLGISGQQLATMNAGDILLGPLAQKIKDTANPQTLIEPIRATLGRAGGQLIPFLKSDIEGLGESMKKMGAIMSTDTAEKLKDLKDKLSLMSQIIVANLAPAMLTLAKTVLMAAANLLEFGEWLAEKTGVKGASATFGALQAQIGTANTFKYLEGILAAKFSGHLDLAELDKQYGVNRSLLQSSAAAGSGAGYENFDEMIKAIDDALAALRAPPKPPGGANVPSTDDQQKTSLKNIKGDSNELIRVGNFMGSSRDAIGNLQRQAVQQETTTARNTGLMVNLLQELVGKGMFSTTPVPFGMRDSIFPSS